MIDSSDFRSIPPKRFETKCCNALNMFGMFVVCTVWVSYFRQHYVKALTRSAAAIQRKILITYTVTKNPQLLGWLKFTFSLIAPSQSWVCSIVAGSTCLCKEGDGVIAILTRTSFSNRSLQTNPYFYEQMRQILQLGNWLTDGKT